MKSRLYMPILTVLIFAAVLMVLSNLDSDIETLLKAGINQKKPAIVVNQVGYLPQWQKKAFLRRSTAFSSKQNIKSATELINQETNEVLAEISSKAETVDLTTKDGVTVIDFSSITEPGTYYLQQGKLKSVPFAIGKDIYQKPLATMIRSYYLQRCGVELNDPVTGISHVPCHIKDGIIARQDKYHDSNELLDATGGWHDTGAYSKNVATTTVAIARLLNLYEQNPRFFPDSQLDIPESGNGTSDLLDEMQFGLDWLLKMQRADGAVYRKISGKSWPINLGPDEDIQPRYIYGVSTPETAKFAAVMAIASRNWQSIDDQTAAKYLMAAESAWQYLQSQPTMTIDWQPEDDSGSDSFIADEFNTEVSLNTDLDDRLWAAAELAVTTGKEEFNSYFASNLDQVEYTLFEWKNPAPLGLIDYLELNPQPLEDGLKAKIQSKIKARAELILARVNQSTYNIANNRFIWGSNKMTAEEGITLIQAYKLTQNASYLNAAIDQLDYLLGRNHFNQTFVTEIGANSVQNLSNLYTRVKRITFPGLVVGGANASSHDGMVLRNRGQLSYIDDEKSYITNANMIDYNASLISLIVQLVNI